jgi:signal transduction histidine kinase
VPDRHRSPGSHHYLLQSVFDNALAAGTPPVSIEIKAIPAMLDSGSALRIMVHDNGPGIAPEERHKVFDPFCTTKAKGTGLGLAIARRIVEAHGGRIEVGDALTPGAIFQLTLPRRMP